jgi:hypothetical protein
MDLAFCGFCIDGDYLLIIQRFTLNRSNCMQDPRSVLKSKKMRITPIREQVIGMFMGAHRALSHSDLEKKLGPLSWRVD